MNATTRPIVSLLEALGGLSRARRAFRVCVVLFGALGLMTPVAHASPDDPVVRVVERDGVYRVSATFAVPHPARLAMEVLTDYEHIAAFMSDVKVSRVIERRAGETLVEQEAVARLLLFSRRIHLALEIVETPGLIRFRDTCGQSFHHYEGAWRIVEEGDYARVTYELVARPTAGVPATIVRRLFSRDVQRTIEQLTREIGRRAVRAEPVTTR